MTINFWDIFCRLTKLPYLSEHLYHGIYSIILISNYFKLQHGGRTEGVGKNFLWQTDTRANVIHPVQIIAAVLMAGVEGQMHTANALPVLTTVLTLKVHNTWIHSWIIHTCTTYKWSKGFKVGLSYSALTLEDSKTARLWSPRVQMKMQKKLAEISCAVTIYTNWKNADWPLLDPNIF